MKLGCFVWIKPVNQPVKFVQKIVVTPAKYLRNNYGHMAFSPIPIALSVCRLSAALCIVAKQCKIDL